MVQVVPLLDPRYPCHSQCHVHMRVSEQGIEIPYERTCPVCGKEWIVMRKYRSFGGSRIDELEWKEK